MIYRLSIETADGSQGFVFFGDKAAAVKRAAQERRWHRAAYADLPRKFRPHVTLEIEEIKTPSSKAEVLALLTVYASHPDNG